MISPADNALPGQPLSLPAGQFLIQGVISGTSPLLASVTFDLAHYHPRDFGQYSIPCPQAVRLASPKRQAEYLASRWLAGTVFARYGIPDFVLTNNADRSPCWPAGFNGSLSHSAGTAFLLADHQGRLAGCDVESWVSPQTADEITHLLMNEQEKLLLTACALPWTVAVTVLFSLKESLYKALWPVVRQYIDFMQAEITAFDPDTGQASLRLRERLGEELPQGREFPARFLRTEAQVFSWIVAG